MMDEIKHAPLPWRKEIRGRLSRIVDANGEIVLVIPEWDSDISDYILSACNAYPALVAALEEFWKAIDHRNSCWECYGNGQWSGMCPQCGYLFDAAVEKALDAREALALARGNNKAPDGANERG